MTDPLVWLPFSPDHLGEDSQDRPVQRAVPQRVAEQLGVGDGGGVVPLAGGGFVIDHDRDPSGLSEICVR